MQTIGLIGGMSWESTADYYRIINETVREKLGGLHSAKILLHSVDFAEIEALQGAGDWDGCADILGGAAAGLVSAGADFIVISANTPHKVAPQIESRAGAPVLHIADAAAGELKRCGVSRVGLLGTIYTMKQDFYRDRLGSFGIETLIPCDADAETVSGVIFGELCRGVVRPESKAAYLRVISSLEARRAQGVVLGCTEIGMLIKNADTPLPVFDTTIIHARAAALRAME